jgi:spore coat polysaccharide biosynthesis protein SpsF
MNKIGALIPVRLASERLPGKALKNICGRPLIFHLLDRVCASRFIEKECAVVCTTRDKSDDLLEEVVTEYGASVFRGSKDDIIQRFYDAMEAFHFNAVIQVDGDDILCSPAYMDMTMERLLEDETLDIVTCENLPLGVASKSFTKRAMDKVYKTYRTKENDTGFIYFFTKSGICRHDIIYPMNKDHVLDEARLTLDYAEDLEVFTKIFEALYKKGEVFDLEEFIPFLNDNPKIMSINQNRNVEYWERTQEKAQLQFENNNGELRKISF